MIPSKKSDDSNGSVPQIVPWGSYSSISQASRVKMGNWELPVLLRRELHRVLFNGARFFIIKVRSRLFSFLSQFHR